MYEIDVLLPFGLFCVAKILVPIANGSEEMEIVVIIDILRRVAANVIVASIEDELEIVASGKVKVIADMLLDEAIKLKYDLIILPVSNACDNVCTCKVLSDLTPFAFTALGWLSWCSSTVRFREAH